MGGRGSAGNGARGSYNNLPVSTLERMLSIQEQKLREAKLAHNTIKSNTSSVIRRRINSDTRKHDAAFQEIKKIESALVVAKKREKRRPVPF